ncbi:DUF1236 domain-containing protein [Microvirga alba]|uniref:DUF1236 domain-containing protein n=1 Tax=Microvirga alba TaxID=2791025 RepID=A0A931FNM9_9HYPH|nr:DUF1236 domain-containing protein [Microvirga alba]MBF9232492.1 DUF1236 domain-containing protein [Microvirga alba]
MRSTLLAATTTVCLLAGLAASAQPSTPMHPSETTRPAQPMHPSETMQVPTTGSVTIAPEKRTIIHEQLRTAKPVTLNEKVAVGWTVPQTVELLPFPDTVVTDVPVVKTYRFFRYGNEIVLVDPETRKVVTIIE